MSLPRNAMVWSVILAFHFLDIFTCFLISYSNCILSILKHMLFEHFAAVKGHSGTLCILFFLNVYFHVHVHKLCRGSTEAK